MSNAAPALVLFSATICLGLYNVRQFLRGQRKVGATAMHFLLGAAGLEAFVMLLFGTQAGGLAAAGPLATGIAALFLAALIGGTVAQVIRGRSARAMRSVLIAHIGAGAAGFLLLLVWVVRR
jgi:hypothetical protein